MKTLIAVSSSVYPFCWILPSVYIAYWCTVVAALLMPCLVYMFRRISSVGCIFFFFLSTILILHNYTNLFICLRHYCNYLSNNLFRVFIEKPYIKWCFSIINGHNNSIPGNSCVSLLFYISWNIQSLFCWSLNVYWELGYQCAFVAVLIFVYLLFVVVTWSVLPLALVVVDHCYVGHESVCDFGTLLYISDINIY